MKRVGIVGHFGFGHGFADGQTVKTKNLSSGLKKYTDTEVLEVHTYGWSKHPLRLFGGIRKAFKQCDTVIMLPAHNGIKVFAPLLAFFKRIYRKRIVYDVIGGWLPEFLSLRPRVAKCLKGFDGIWVETETMKSKLSEQGFTNVTVVPNFKELTPLNEAELVYPEAAPYKLCTFSRVMKEKGIEDAVNTVIKVNEDFGSAVLSLDIYGQIDANYKERFSALSESFPEYICYGGCVSSDKSTEVLKNYFALLFPTYYEGEGFAGTLIDAYCAGIPVIASDWRYNSEIVNEKTGYVYPTGDNEKLFGILKAVADKPDLILSKKKCCVAEAEKYRIEKVIRDIEALL